AEDGIRDSSVTGVQTCALPICPPAPPRRPKNPRPVDWQASRTPEDVATDEAKLEVEEMAAQAASAAAAASEPMPGPVDVADSGRSEERRVGNECSWRGGSSRDR